MFKKGLFLLLAALLQYSAEAAPGKQGKNLFPQLTPPAIVTRQEEERPQVKLTGEFSSMPIPARKDTKSQAPAGSSAAMLTQRGMKFNWKPSPRLSSTIRSADLTGAAISPDGTLAVIAERVGGEEKPNSTRILLFNIPERSIAGGFLLNETLVSDIAFTGSKMEIAGISHASPFFKTGNALVKINLKQQKITAKSAPVKGEFTSWEPASGGRIFCTLKGSSEIFEYDLNELSAAPTVFKTKITAPRICVAGKTLAAYGREGVEIFRQDEGRWVADEEICKAPENFKPLKALVIDAAVPAICFAENFEDSLWYFRKDTFKKIKERISGIQLWDNERKIFFAELAANGRISMIQMPEAEETEKPAAPNRLKPANSNSSFALLKAPSLKNQMLQVDNRGNLFMLDYSRPARWKKFPVSIADEAGFRR